MTTRRAVIAGSVLVAGVGALGATGALGPLARAAGVEPVARPNAADTSLLAAVVKDQNRVLAVVRGSGHNDAVALLETQIRRLGGTPGTAPSSGDAAATLAQAAGYRADDAVAAQSSELAQVLASVSAGLDLCVSLVRSAS